MDISKEQLQKDLEECKLQIAKTIQECQSGEDFENEFNNKRYEVYDLFCKCCDISIMLNKDRLLKEIKDKIEQFATVEDILSGYKCSKTDYLEEYMSKRKVYFSECLLNFNKR